MSHTCALHKYRKGILIGNGFQLDLGFLTAEIPQYESRIHTYNGYEYEIAGPHTSF